MCLQLIKYTSRCRIWHNWSNSSKQGTLKSIMAAKFKMAAIITVIWFIMFIVRACYLWRDYNWLYIHHNAGSDIFLNSSKQGTLKSKTTAKFKMAAIITVIWLVVRICKIYIYRICHMWSNPSKQVIQKSNMASESKWSSTINKSLLCEPRISIKFRSN